MVTTDETDEAARLAAECAKLRQQIAALESQRVEASAKQSEALAAIQSLSRYVIESAHEGIIVYGPDLRYQLWNPCMERLSGKKAAEVLGKHPFEVFPGLVDAGVAARVEQALAGEVPEPLEFAFDVAGRPGWLVDTSVPLRDETGRVVGVIATVQDITDRRRAQELARTHLHLYEFAGEHSLHELLVETLNAVEDLTESKIGFFHFVQPDERTLSLQAWSTRTTQKFCKAIGAGAHYDLEHAGVWTDCMRQRGPVVHNDYASLPHKKGLPEGHAPVVRELVVPILREGLIVAILGVGNKDSDYTQDDVRTVTDLANAAWEVAQRKRAEEWRREGEHFVRSVLETTPNLVYIYDLEEHRNRYANQEVANFLGYTPDAIREMGTSLFANILHPDDVAAVTEHHARLASGKKSLATLEYRMRHASGEWRWLRSRDVPFSKKPDGTVRSILGSTDDVTEQRRVLAVLRESEHKLREILNASPFPTALVDLKEENILFWSDSAQRKFGHTPPTATEWYRLAYPDPEVRAEAMARWRSCMEVAVASDHPVNAGEYPITCADGRVLTCELYAMVMSSNLVVTLADVTERKQMEAERQRLQSELFQAQKIESVGRLAGGVAHDFNNMLGVILGQTELAMDSMDPSHPLYADIQMIRKAAERSADLTRQLLAFARKQTVAPKLLDLNETVGGMLKIIRRLIGENIQLSWVPGQDVGMVKIDPSQLDQILANLCVNARDAFSAAGRLTIKTGCTTFDENTRSVHPSIVPGEYVYLSVSDDGCGMDSETLSHLFEPFFTTKETGKGTGLGLAMVFGIVRQNNGFIDVQSKPGQGTTFTIHLPRHAKEEQAQEVAALRSTTPQGETILLVEDEVSMRRIAVRMLKRLGYSVIDASGPAEAIRIAKEYAGQIDLLLTDVVMPEMNGRELVKNLLASYPKLKHVFMSGYTADVIAHHGVLDEGVEFLEKPFAMDVLAAKLREVLAVR
jgi:PAS domain S-box-containing protein